MVNHDMYIKVAEEISRQMDQGGLAYTTKTRLELGTLLRQVSGQPRSKIGKNVGDAIEAALEQRGFRTFPHINDVGTNEAVRIFRTSSFVNQILNAFLHPGATTDTQLAKLITTYKQQDKILKWEH